MKILRTPPYPLILEVDVPDANTEYHVDMKDSFGDYSLEGVYTSNGNSKIVIELTDNFTIYDETHHIHVYSYVDEVIGYPVLEDTVEIVRPYVIPTGSTATEIQQSNDYNEIARDIIDSITSGFYYKKTITLTTGLGTDYLPMWNRPQNILQIVENNKLVFDSSLENPAIDGYFYTITLDKNAITKIVSEEYNRRESSALFLPSASSDLLDVYGRSGPMFPSGYDYIIFAESGYVTVPRDIQRAAELLADDIKCGRLDYYSKYVKNYSTDQFKIEYDSKMLDGTGNLIVDKILEKYKPTVHKFGVL